MLKQRKNPWGPGTPYSTYAEYWEFDVVAVLAQKYKALTGEDVAFPDIQRIEQLQKTKLEKVGDFGTES